jgi:regulator of sirC expression with transglutaminase-like and TPR domain
VIFEPKTILSKNGKKEDADINLLHVCLAFAAYEHPGISIDRYLNHIDKLVVDVGDRYISLLNAGAKDDAGTQLAALKHILCDREGYAGDTQTYNDLQNADLMRVIDRRKGMPIALSILYIHVGRANGWELDGLNFPGHFLCRLQKDSARLIFDPFQSCMLMEAHDLRALIKKMQGDRAELSADYYKPCNNRDMAFRLQNNIKSRLIEGEEYEHALLLVDRMRLLDEGEYRLYLDAGVLYMKTGRLKDAKAILEKYIQSTPNAVDRIDAQALLNELRDV